jgi:hypothetical protein
MKAEDQKKSIGSAEFEDVPTGFASKVETLCLSFTPGFSPVISGEAM